jgi:hypothetical protein
MCGSSQGTRNNFSVDPAGQRTADSTIQDSVFDESTIVSLWDVFGMASSHRGSHDSVPHNHPVTGT